MCRERVSLAAGGLLLLVGLWFGSGVVPPQSCEPISVGYVPVSLVSNDVLLQRERHLDAPEGHWKHLRTTKGPKDPPKKSGSVTKILQRWRYEERTM